MQVGCELICRGQSVEAVKLEYKGSGLGLEVATCHEAPFARVLGAELARLVWIDRSASIHGLEIGPGRIKDPKVVVGLHQIQAMRLLTVKLWDGKTPLPNNDALPSPIRPPLGLLGLDFEHERRDRRFSSSRIGSAVWRGWFLPIWILTNH